MDLFWREYGGVWRDGGVWKMKDGGQLNAEVR